MHTAYAVFMAAIFISSSGALRAQSPAKDASTAPAPVQAESRQQGAQPAPDVQPPAPIPPIAASGLLQPALDTVQQKVGAVRLEKWKRGTIREETAEDIDSIQRDLQNTLPPMLRQADDVQGTVSNVLPISRNINSLYDVLLRVVQAARISGLPDDIVQLQQALIGLGSARRALDDRLQEAATAQEKQLVDLRRTVKAQAAIKCPAVPPPATPACATATPPKRPKKKPAAPAKPAQTPASPAPATPKTGP
ncbi:MAG: hypothetical protein ABSE87_06610 [Terracidiphilus sp.]|jgi:hypothetical protein